MNKQTYVELCKEAYESLVYIGERIQANGITLPIAKETQYAAGIATLYNAMDNAAVVIGDNIDYIKSRENLLVSLMLIGETLREVDDPNIPNSFNSLCLELIQRIRDKNYD